MATITKTVTLIPSGYTGLTGMTINSSYPVDRGYTDADSTTYCRFDVNTSTTGSVYFTFDTSDIPAGATITSVTARGKARVSNTTRVTNTVMQLYANTTAKGSNRTFAATTASTQSITAGTWTRTELNNLRLKIGGTASSSTSSRRIDFYGADVTVTYTVTAYDITISNSTSATVEASESTVGSGDSVMITTDTLTGITITDNGADITSAFVQESGGTVSKTASGTLDKTFTDSGGAFYISSSNSTTQYLEYAIGHTAESPGNTGTQNTYVKGSASGNSTTGDAIYSFDFSEIPLNATITNVTVKCYGAVEDSSQSTSHADITLYSGSTQKSTTQKFTSTSNSIITISSPGSWTAAELHEAKLHFKLGYYGGRLFGITWTVTYTANGYEYIITNVTANHAIVVAPSGGGGNPPVITVGTPTRTIISDESGYDQCVCTFTSDLALQAWEARATKSGVTPARGVGLLVENGGSLAAGATGTVYVENEELTQGDGDYTITVYGQSTGGIWSQ